MPSIANQLPIIFANQAQLTTLSGYCACCNDEIPSTRMRGSITRPLTNVVTIEAVGMCAACSVATPFLFRVYDDLRLSAPTKRGWATWMPRRSIAGRLRKLMKNLLQPFFGKH